MLNQNYDEKEKIGLLIIDLQEKLLPKIPNHKNLISNVIFLIKGLSIFKLPIIISQQYPQGLGPLSEALKRCIYDELQIKKHSEEEMNRYYKKAMSILDEIELPEGGYIYYNGISTIRQKCAFAKSKLAAGVMIWELQQDSHDEKSLTKAIAKELN